MSVSGSRDLMKKIDLSTLSPGTVAYADLYTEGGELLVSRGVTITEKHLNVLQRRNIFEVYVKLQEEDEEIHKILTKDFEDLGELHFDDPSHSVLNKPRTAPAPKAYETLQLSKVKTGQEGLLQLLQSDKIREFDATIKDGFFPDRPVGPPLKSRAALAPDGQRTDAYKAEVKTSYAEAVQNIRYILNALADSKSVDGSIIRNIVEGFVRTWLADRSILLNVINLKSTDEEYLYHHSLNVSLLSINIAAAAGYSEKQVIDIGIGAALHDVGMLLVPKEIRLKKGRLTKDEWYEVQKHSVLGLHILEKVSKLPESAPYIAYQTHERENGQGYPKQRNSRLIHKYSKVVQIADVFESLSSPREYRNAYMPYRAMEIIIKMSRKDLLASDLVKCFISYMSLFPVGSMVELNDHTVGKVVQANELHYTKPVVSIVADSRGSLLSKDKIHQVDLSKNQNLQIIKAIEATKMPGLDIMHGF
jgi:HD-GYP domain-containing protein (c-di-GMP phosphodiesterase class II)